MPKTKAQTGKRIKELVEQKKFELLRVNVDGSVFSLRKNQCDELAKWAAGDDYEEDWLIVDTHGPKHFVNQKGEANALTLTPEAWLEEHELIKLKWKELATAQEFGSVRIAVEANEFPLREIQQKELGKWAKGGSYDTDWLLVADDVPTHFVDQSGNQHALVLGDDAWMTADQKGSGGSSGATSGGGGKKKKTSGGAAPASKKSKQGPTGWWTGVDRSELGEHFSLFQEWNNTNGQQWFAYWLEDYDPEPDQFCFDPPMLPLDRKQLVSDASKYEKKGSSCDVVFRSAFQPIEKAATAAAKQACATALQLCKASRDKGYCTSSESDYEYVGIVMAFPKSLDMTVANICKALGVVSQLADVAHFNEADEEEDDDDEEEDDEDEEGGKFQDLEKLVTQYFPTVGDFKSVFAGTEQVNPVPAVWVKRHGEFLVGLMSGMIFT